MLENNLIETTFLIPIKLESQDRINNAISVLGYLNHHFKTNVFIYEAYDEKEIFPQINLFGNLNIKYWSEKSDKRPFHKTRFLNTMLKDSKTPVTCQYDIDVLFSVNTYLFCQKAIVDKKETIIYPYPEGMGQIKIFQKFDRKEFNETFDINCFSTGKIKHTDIDLSYCGHACFLDTETYKEFGGENELFISWGPEDVEKLLRFERRGSVIGRLSKNYVYHFEHFRGLDSGKNNVFFDQNNKEFERFMDIPSEKLAEYLPPIKQSYD